LGASVRGLVGGTSGTENGVVRGAGLGGIEVGGAGHPGAAAEEEGELPTDGSGGHAGVVDVDDELDLVGGTSDVHNPDLLGFDVQDLSDITLHGDEEVGVVVSDDVAPSAAAESEGELGGVDVVGGTVGLATSVGDDGVETVGGAGTVVRRLEGIAHVSDVGADDAALEATVGTSLVLGLAGDVVDGVATDSEGEDVAETLRLEAALVVARVGGGVLLLESTTGLVATRVVVEGVASVSIISLRFVIALLVAVGVVVVAAVMEEGVTAGSVGLEVTSATNIRRAGGRTEDFLDDAVGTGFS